MNVKKINYQKSIGRWAVVFALLGALLLSGTVFAEGEVPQASCGRSAASSCGRSAASSCGRSAAG